MSASDRVRFAPVEGAAELFTPQFNEFLMALHDRFTPRVHELRARRARVLENALKRGVPPGPLPPSAATTGDWRGPPPPDALLGPAGESSRPARPPAPL